MEDPRPRTPTPRKRSVEDDDAPAFSTPLNANISEPSTPLSVLSDIQTPSPLKSSATSSTAPDSNVPSAIAGHQTTPASSSAQQPAKRRKLTQKERDDQRADKEAKAKARADKKAQKDAEDKLKAEGKRKKNEERDEKKRQKEEEQQLKDEEKAKKERTQMRLNAFFVKPKANAAIAEQTVVVSTQNPIASQVSLSSSSSSSSSVPTGLNTSLAPPSPQKAIVKNAKSYYERYFLPFNLPAYAILAPTNAFLDNPIKLAAAQTRLDTLINDPDVLMESITLKSLKEYLPVHSWRGLQTATIMDIFERVNGSSNHPIDITNDPSIASRQPLGMLKEIPMKYIHFHEDVRPPYYGTYTRVYTDAEAAHLARNPLSRTRQDTNYDYDSEAEWEEPEEGEDLDSDGEDDNEEEADDDMDGFLDDEEDLKVKRGLISGELVPVSTGLCWEDAHRVSRLNDGSGAICTEFKDFSMGFLLDSHSHSQPIDPFSIAYWALEPAPIKAIVGTSSKEPSTNSFMNPPRPPLAQRTMNGLLNTLNTPQIPTTTPIKAGKPKRLIPADQMSAFKAEIDGKDLTKIGMVEALKKVFPKFPKDAITNTLSVVAARVGPTEREKRWVLISA